MMELYSQLTEDEFVYVHELQKCYDESRCFFVMWILSEETKELVNSARISAVQAGHPFAWKQCREEIQKSLTDDTLTTRFLALARLRRKQGSSAKLWVSQVTTRRALLEDPQLPAPITLPETLYLELTLGQMSPAETTIFDIPAIGDDLSAKDGCGEPKYTMARINEAPKPLSPVYSTLRTKVDAIHPRPAKRKRTSSNPTRTRPATPAQLTRSPPTSRQALNVPTLPPLSTAAKSPMMPSASFSTTSKRTVARGATRMATIAPSVLCLL
jgi:hypothetical protein